MIRAYAKVVGIALVLIAVADVLFDVRGGSPLESMLYLITGGIFAYMGFRSRNPRDTRYVVGGMGVLYLLASVFVLALVFLLGLPLRGEDNRLVGDLLHAVFGILSILVAALLPCEDDPPATP